MIARAVSVALLVLVPAVLAGCTDEAEEPVDDAALPSDAPAEDPAASPGERDAAPQADPPSTGTWVAPPPGSAPLPAEPRVVVAHVDTGVNPYHRVFRDASDRAQRHPSEYIPGYPADAQALVLSLDAPSYEEALARDAHVWANVTEGVLYWVPGTKIVGAISFGPGGTRCSDVEFVQDACPTDTPVLDDHGHGTMTATRSAGREGSLAPDALFVSVEGLGGDGVRWIADQGWIDVQTNSWLSLVPPPAGDRVDGTASAFAHAASRMVTIAASGNGAVYFTGFAPTPTYLLSTAAPGVLLVGAHDNGRATLWHGSPPHVVADGYGGRMAGWRSLDEFGPHGEACCTSAAAPYAAGGAAAIVLEARRLLGDTTVGPQDGVLARGPAGLYSGPLEDGALNLTEFREIYLKTATPRPTEGPDDGLAHWLATGGAPADPADPGGNPYCPGCWTTPLEWRQVPADAPTYPLLGYGAVDPASVALALDVLRGGAMPARATEDAAFGADQTARTVLPGGSG